MKTSISLYPRLDIDSALEIFNLESPSFSYKRDGHIYELTKSEEDDFSAVLKDEKGNWSADTDDLYVNWDLSCISPSRLYGKSDELGVACDNAKIGIALQWSSKKSQQRGTIPLGIVTNQADELAIGCQYAFPKTRLRGSISLSVILYIAEAGVPNEDEQHFANIPGFIIGELGKYEIFLDGNGSFFPIYEIEKKGAPLWSVDYDMLNPESDDFSESISIFINKKHASYPLIDRNNSQFNPQLFIEIMAQALVLIVETIRTEDPDFDCLNEVQSGSVAEALLYFREHLNWDLSSPINLSKSIRKDLETRINA